MPAIDTSNEFANRSEIPEELRADFDYLETHFMYKDWVVQHRNFVPFLHYFLKIPKKTTDDFLNRVPKELQKPLKFYNEEGQIRTFQPMILQIFMSTQMGNVSFPFLV